MGKLEIIVSSNKKHWKEIVTAIALPLIFANNVNAGFLGTRCNSSLTRPSMEISHRTGATEPEEGYDGDGIDILFNDMQFPPTIDIYSKINFDPYRLKRDARPPESMTTINSEISGRGLGASTNANLQFTFYDIGEDNFSKKNIIGELSQRIDDGKGSYNYALIGNYDIKKMVNSSRTIPISVDNGITQGDVFFPSHKLNYYFFNHADLNRDRKVDGLDFAIFAQNWGINDPNTLGTNVGADPNNLDSYSDIDRSGAVDCNDLGIFSGEWLYNADDPNTW